MKTEIYVHHDEPVHVQPHLKGKHREHCLCFGCASFKPGSPENCYIAQSLFDICVEQSLVTPVYECPDFVAMPPEKVTLSGREPETPAEPSAPAPIDPSTGQHKDYWMLSEEDRAKGFLRPVRKSYRHVGSLGPKYPLRDLTLEEKHRFARMNYAKFEDYPESESPASGRFWTRAELDYVGNGCGSVTSMGSALAETYARDPDFYGSTFCYQCGTHRPVTEFVWDDTEERVGS